MVLPEEPLKSRQRAVPAEAQTRVHEKPLCPRRAQRLCGLTANSGPHHGERSDGSNAGVVVSLADMVCGERNSITPGATHVTWT
jgi:hypothetical protein